MFSGLVLQYMNDANVICRLRDASNEQPTEDSADITSADILTARDFADKIVYAFQLATAQGPLCAEPVQGIAVFLEDVSINMHAEEESNPREKLGRLTGEVIKTVRDSIRQGFLDWSPRMLLAMYSCEIQASSRSSYLQISNPRQR